MSGVMEKKKRRSPLEKTQRAEKENIKVSIKKMIEDENSPNIFYNLVVKVVSPLLSSAMLVNVSN